MINQQELIERAQAFLCGLGYLDNYVPGLQCQETKEGVNNYLLDKKEKTNQDLTSSNVLNVLMQDGMDLNDEDEVENMVHELWMDTDKKPTSKLPALKYNVKDGKINVDLKWYKNNIASIKIPQLRHCTQFWEKVKVNKAIADQTLDMFNEFEKLHLTKFILSFNGAYNPRFIRGSTTRLSNHSLGLAIDLNAQWNKLGAQPAKRNEKGSLIELVPTMNKFGFMWGGHYNNRKDAMHLECLYIM